MGVNSHAKGARGEREARDQVRLHWNCPDCIRAAQACGAYGADLLEGPPKMHLEVKLHKRIVALDHLAQADRDRRADEIPVVLMRETSGKEKRWAVMLFIDDTDKFMESLNDCK